MYTQLLPLFLTYEPSQIRSRICMETSEHNSTGLISERWFAHNYGICWNILKEQHPKGQKLAFNASFWQEAFWMLFFQNIPTNPIVSQIYFFYDITLRDSVEQHHMTTDMDRLRCNTHSDHSSSSWRLASHTDILMGLSRKEDCMTSQKNVFVGS